MQNTDQQSTKCMKYYRYNDLLIIAVTNHTNMQPTTITDPGMVIEPYKINVNVYRHNSVLTENYVNTIQVVW